MEVPRGRAGHWPQVQRRDQQEMMEERTGVMLYLIRT
jgi:hypothetical protein